jgi:hypothetical protein
MDSTADQPIESDKPITVTDISEFFVTYTKNDSLGHMPTWLLQVTLLLRKIWPSRVYMWTTEVPQWR